MARPSSHAVDEVTIRAASTEDAELLWVWANDPQTRRWSFQSGQIPWETHVAWLNTKLADPLVRVFIVGAGATPKAAVRFEKRADHVAVVSIVVDPSDRGRGWGTRALRLSCRSAAHELALKRVDAYIKPANNGSIVAFKRAGFVRAAEPPDADALRMVWRAEH